MTKPTLALLAQLSKLPPGILSDTLQFDFNENPEDIISTALSYKGKPVAGRAFITRGNIVDKPVDDEFRLRMLNDIQRGDIQVVTQCDYRVACYGDISALLAKKFGAVGALINGPTRDIAKMPNNFGIAYESLNARDAYGQWELFSVGGFARLSDGVKIMDGDIIHMSEESIIVIRSNLKLFMVERKARIRMARENMIRGMIRRGDNPSYIYKEEGRW